MHTFIIADDEEKLRSAIAERADCAAIGFEVVGKAEKRRQSSLPAC